MLNRFYIFNLSSLNWFKSIEFINSALAQKRLLKIPPVWTFVSDEQLLNVEFFFLAKKPQGSREAVGWMERWYLKEGEWGKLRLFLCLETGLLAATGPAECQHTEWFSFSCRSVKDELCTTRSNRCECMKTGQEESPFPPRLHLFFCRLWETLLEVWGISTAQMSGGDYLNYPQKDLVSRLNGFCNWSLGLADVFVIFNLWVKNMFQCI